MTDSFSRRDFFKKTAVVSAAVALGGHLGANALETKPVLVKCAGPGVPADISKAIHALLEPLGGMKAFVKKGQTVLLKPNMGFPTPPEQRATTSPLVVAAVAKEVLSCGASKVLILDNPLRRPEACLKIAGFKEATQDLDVHVLLPTSEKMYAEKPIPQGKSLHKTRILKDALEVDVHIALPIAKSHNATGFSGGMKGMMGLILDRESFHSQYDINQAIADLNTVLRPGLTILDGLQVMATDGPSGPGELITCNTLIAGTDIVAVDSAGVELAPLYGRKLRPKQIRHLKAAEEMNLGKLSLSSELVLNLNL